MPEAGHLRRVRARVRGCAAAGLALGLAWMGAALAAPPAAMVPTPAQARRLVEALLVASPYKLPDAARRGHIRYRLAFGPGPAPPLVETGEQHVIAQDGGVRVDVCARCGREPAPDAAQLARLRAPGRWIESDAPSIRAFAARHDRGGSLERRMRVLRDAVRARLDGPVDFTRYDSALQAWRARGGDCTESALLLAAVARARGIPARVAYGVAYSSRFTGKAHVFSPHMWVQVWDGARWTSHDAGLERFDAGHIALVVGDGDFDAFAPATAWIARMRIEGAAGIAAAPETSAGS